MNGLIPISYLNDFLFCPYSIYLHQVYRGTEEETVKAIPQKAGTAAHRKQEQSTRGNPNLLFSLPVLSETIGIYGVTDEFDTKTNTLTEYKNNLTTVYPGQRMQLYAQYFCMKESGYPVRTIRLVGINSRKEFTVPIPGETELKSLEELISQIRYWNPENDISLNINKCRKCIYCPLCEKTNEENVF